MATSKTEGEARWFWDKVKGILGVPIPPRYRTLLEEIYKWEKLEAGLADLKDYLEGVPMLGRKASMFEQCVKEVGEPVVEPLIIEKAPSPEPEKAEGGDPEVWWLEEYPELPNLVRAIMESNLSGTDWCLDFSLAGALALISGAVGNRLKFYSWNIYGFPNEYFMLIGSTGDTYKSYQVRAIYQYLSDTNPTLLAPDAGSWQGLMRHLCDSPSALWCLDEWSGLLGEMKTQDYQKRLREILQTLFHHGGAFKRRLSREAYESENPALSILTGIQPEVFGEEMLGRREVEAGLVNRFLLVLADMPEQTWPKLEWDTRLTQKSRCVRKLRELGQASSTVFADPVQEMASIWQGRWREFFGDEGDIVGKRSSIHALKIACLLWVADVGIPPNRTVIPERWVKVALDILERWFYRSAQFIGETRIKVPDERTRRDILEFIRSRDDKEATLKDISKFTQLGTRKLNEHMEALMLRELVARRELDSGREAFFVP